MKKLTFFLFIILSVNTYSQSPSNFTYQSVVRDGSGKLLSNKEISFRISVLKNSESGQVVFEEEHSVTTNINGLATLIVGKGSGNDDLGDIDWGDGSYFLKVEIDPEGGFNFIAEDTTQLLSVPYALYSSSSGSSLTITGQDYLSINNNELTVNKVDLTDDVVGILPIVNGGTGSSTVPMVGVITAADAASARNVLGLSTVASTGSYNDLTDKLTAGANIDITNGIISSTDTNTEYTAGTGISIDGNNAISTTITDTNTFRTVQADGTAIGDTEILNLVGGTNVTLTENAGEITITSTDNNTTYTAGTGLSLSTTTFNLNHLGFQDLSDPNSDRFIFWDDSESKIDWLSAASLFDIVGLSPDDDNFIVGNGTNFITESGATARSSLGLGTMATQDNTSVNIDGGNIDGSTISTSDITVGLGKTIDVSGGTLTLANNQISGDKVEGGTIASTTITSLTTNSITNSGKTIDNSGGSSGVTTINATVGRVKINSGQSSINISNSYVDANSIIICTVAQNSDSTRYITQVVAGSGTFTIDLNGGAPGSGILINFLIIN